jgi:hypothetical protein
VQEELVGWDLQNIHRQPSTSLKLYLLFLLFVCAVTTVKLLKAWQAAPPFRLSRQACNPTYLRGLEASSISLKHWIGCTILAWGILTSTSLYEVCNRLVGEKTIGSATFLVLLEDYSTVLSMALIVVLFVFLVRWHLLTRIERLRK